MLCVPGCTVFQLGFRHILILMPACLPQVLPGLHLCGEVLDVFGRIGGFNFYWAWVSGRLAGIGAAVGADEASVGRVLREQREVWGGSEWKEDW